MPKLQAKIRIWPCPTKTERGRHLVLLDVGVQRFQISEDFESEETARWMAKMLRTALSNAGANVSRATTVFKGHEVSQQRD